MSYYWHDEEAVYQDADIEQAEMEAYANRLHRLERSGVCTHQRTVGIGADGVAHYPEAEGLTGEQRRCCGCGLVFASDSEWDSARDAFR
jgi:hypothetical protein